MEFLSIKILNYIKITTDREKRLVLLLIVLILKTFQTSMKASEVFNVETSTHFGKLVKKTKCSKEGSEHYFH